MKRAQKKPVVVSEAFLKDMERVSKLLHQYWPGVQGKLDRRPDGTWRICIQPGEWVVLGKVDEEIADYLQSHPMTQEKVMEEFTRSLMSMFGSAQSPLGKELLPEQAGNRSSLDERSIAIKCQCGNRFVVKADASKKGTVSKCPSCSKNYRLIPAHAQGQVVDRQGTRWLIHAEGKLCDLCSKVSPVKDALDGRGKVFHLCQPCFDDQWGKSAAQGPIQFGTFSKR